MDNAVACFACKPISEDYFVVLRQGLLAVLLQAQHMVRRDKHVVITEALMVCANGMFQQTYLQENVIGLCDLDELFTFQTTITKGENNTLKSENVWHDHFTLCNNMWLNCYILYL